MGRGAEERPALVFDETQLEALKRTLALFTNRTRARGEQYAIAGRVGAIQPFERGMVARVHGTETYETSWDWNGRRWESDCTCPIGGYCKHAYAVGATALARSHTRTPPAAPKARAGSAPRAPSIIDRLRAARDAWSRRGLVHMLVRRTGGVDFYRLQLDEVLEEPDPDLLCWRLARKIHEAAPGHVPPPLEEYRHRPDLAEKFAARERAGLVAELVRWAERHRAPPVRSLRAVLSLDRQGGRVAVTLETRLTSPKLADEPRSLLQLQQLRNDARDKPNLLPPEQIAMLDLIADSQAELFGGHSPHGTRFTLSGRGLKALARRVAHTDLASWATDVDRELAARAGIEPGGVFRVSDDPARLLPICVERGGETAVDLAFVWPNGRQRLLRDALYLPGFGHWDMRSQPSSVLAAGELSAVIEEPEAPMVEHFLQGGAVPVPRAERGELFGLLASSFPHLGETLSARTRTHRVRAVVALDLRDGDWLQVRLFAYGGAREWKPSTALTDDVIAFECVPTGMWMRLANAATRTAVERDYEQVQTGGEAAPETERYESGESDDSPIEEVWIDAPAAECVAPARDWLERLPAAPGTKGRARGAMPDAADRHVGWWMQASPKGMEALADAWENRPPEVTFFGTPRVRRLLSGEIVLKPRLRIESTGIDWFSVSAEWEGQGLHLTDADLSKLRSANTSFVKLSSGWVRRDAAHAHDEAASVLADLGVEIGEGTQRLSLWQLTGASDESLKALEHLGADASALEAARELRARVASFDGLPAVAVPPDFLAELRPYQKRGLDFLAYASSLGIGAVLADDMGLGKTVQALAWLAHLGDRDPDGGPSLVVCPASVVYNWEREAERFAPQLKVLLLTSGIGRKLRFGAIAEHDLVVTNYALLRRDVETWREVKLRALIFDEAQNLKNPDAAVTRAALSLAARYRLALTGTPLENRALDLWSIVECVNPGYLGPRSRFESRFDRLDAPPHARTLLAAKLRPILLRRTKREVATDLPDRIEERIDCELAKEQRLLYLDELRRSRTLVERLAGAPGGITRNKIDILAALTRLRQLCCHPALAGGVASLASGKFEALFELLEPLLQEGHKVLLFSQFVECLKLLEREFRERDIPYHKLTGSTTKREEVVDAFSDDPRPCVFLVSLKAGGTGLNLTAASYVVLFDPWWNPAVEAQAIDRTHRIGQDRTVIAYRMLTRGTIEEKIWELQQRKAALARDVLGEGGFARALTRGDLDYLLAET